MAYKYTNHLGNETSPYLQQHAHNPVNWYPWGEEALNKAKEENKPILVSIGYSACHWCHVMERESFEDEATAEIMNRHFINIKIDREERPDLDNIYMDAVQAMTGSGGWPLNVFLTPGGKPFFGGTYFPPQRAYNRPSWKEVLTGISKSYEEKKHEIDSQAENLTAHLEQSNDFSKLLKGDADDLVSVANATGIFDSLMKSSDKEWGGFGRAPKFPQSFSILFLLRYYHNTDNQTALQQALLSIDKMIQGGIYDHVGGGFARYSTDTEWLVPHFEKMLYDNALLLTVLAEAYQLTKQEKYRHAIEQTMDFIQREMLHSDGGFYAALDADSEGVEGKFYVWAKKEVDHLLGEDSQIFCEYYDITENGNWEHQNILWVKKPLDEFAQEKNVDATALKEILERGIKRLLDARELRVRPGLDDKIILGWNALMNTACSKVYAATGKIQYRELAEKNMAFLFRKMKDENSEQFYHNWKNDKKGHPAFLDDYAFLIQSLVQLHEITADTGWLIKARDLYNLVASEFSEPEEAFFYYTSAKQQDVIIRKKDVYDSATPSGNAVMAHNLWHLSILFDQNAWKERSRQMVNNLGSAIIKYPVSFGNWACLFFELIAGTNEIAIKGDDYENILNEVLSEYIPYKVCMASSRDEKEDNDWPLLTGKHGADKTPIYLCRNYTCQAPVFSARELMSLINRAKNL